MKRKVNHKTEGRKERAARLRARVWSAWDLGWRLGAAGVLCAALGLGGREAWAWARRSPLFRVESLRVAGAHRAREVEVVKLAGLRAGMNLFAFDAGRAARAVEQHPWVRRARVQRRLPRAVEIRIEEREAAALVALGPLYLADADGEIFKRAWAGDGLDLPVVTGIARRRWAEDAGEATARLRDALALVHAWREMPIAEVHVLEDHALEVETAAGLRVRVGQGGYAEKLLRLKTLDEELRRRGARAAYVDLDNRTRPDFVAVRLRG